MSRIRQNQSWDRAGENEDPKKPVIAVAHDRPADFEVPRHRHFRAQLIYASEGVMRVRTESAAWMVPPQQAVWVPPDVVHSVINESAVAFRSLYLHPVITGGLPRDCCVITVPDLLKELILYLTRSQDRCLPALQNSLMALIPELLATLKPEPLELPLSGDRRLRTITGALMENQADGRGLKEWARQVGASERTLERLFRQELGMGFQRWRQNLRLLSAVALLSEGMPVTSVALEVGYASASAFIAMFRSRLGRPPKRYMKLRGQH